MAITMMCDGCGVEVKDQDGHWSGKLPLVSMPLTPDEISAGKKRGKFSIDHSKMCPACTASIGEFIQTLGK